MNTRLRSLSIKKYLSEDIAKLYETEPEVLPYYLPSNLFYAEAGSADWPVTHRVKREEFLRIPEGASRWETIT